MLVMLLAILFLYMVMQQKNSRLHLMALILLFLMQKVMIYLQ